MSDVVKVRGLNFSYGGPLVLENIDLAVGRGEFVGLVGPNGSGKSTLLQLILGLLPPTTGSIEVCGTSPAQAPPPVLGWVGGVNGGAHETRALRGRGDRVGWADGPPTPACFQWCWRGCKGAGG